MSLDIAERIITEELSRLGWQETGLASPEPGDPSPPGAMQSPSENS